MLFELANIPGVIDPTVIDTEVFALVQQGIQVADAIAAEDTFNYGCAEMSMRNLAGLFNGFDAVDDKTIAKLSEPDVERLQSLAVATYDFLGDEAKKDARANVAVYHPRSESEARTFASTYCALSALQHPLADPPQRGYFMSNISAAMPHSLRHRAMPEIEQGEL